jgi:hypothetical protein
MDYWLQFGLDFSTPARYLQTLQLMVKAQYIQTKSGDIRSGCASIEYVSHHIELGIKSQNKL